MIGVRRGAFTCVGWQVTLCDPIWQVTSRSSEMGFPRRAISAFTFFYHQATLSVAPVNPFISRLMVCSGHCSAVLRLLNAASGTHPCVDHVQGFTRTWMACAQCGGQYVCLSVCPLINYTIINYTSSSQCPVHVHAAWASTP